MDIFSIHLEGMTMWVVLIGLTLVSLGFPIFAVYCLQPKDTGYTKHLRKEWNPYKVLGVNQIMQNQERNVHHGKPHQIKSASVEQPDG